MLFPEDQVVSHSLYPLDKLNTSFLAFVLIAAIVILLIQHNPYRFFE